MRIEDYALIGDLQTSALVGRDGSVDWLCLPRFDSASCFTALLGEEKHGRWLISPAGEVRSVSRRYREGTLVLETDFETAGGTARVIDFMPPRDGGAPQLMRIVQGLRGRVPMRMELIIRFGYGLSVPWVQRVPGGIVAQAGPDAVHLSTPVELHGQDLSTVAEFTVGEGSSERFALSWFPSYERPGRTEDADAALARTQAWWREWSQRCPAASVRRLRRGFCTRCGTVASSHWLERGSLTSRRASRMTINPATWLEHNGTQTVQFCTLARATAIRQRAAPNGYSRGSYKRVDHSMRAFAKCDRSVGHLLLPWSGFGLRGG